MIILWLYEEFFLQCKENHEEKVKNFLVPSMDFFMLGEGRVVLDSRWR